MYVCSINVNIYTFLYPLGPAFIDAEMRFCCAYPPPTSSSVPEDGQELADAVDRAEWQDQSKNNKPAAKKMPKPKAMPESLRPGASNL